MASRKVAPPPPSPRNGPKPALKYVKAGWDYEPLEAGELGFKAGEIIKVTSEHPSGWWFGEIDNRSGTFPSNYTEPYDGPPPASATVASVIAPRSAKISQPAVSSSNPMDELKNRLAKKTDFTASQDTSVGPSRASATVNRTSRTMISDGGGIKKPPVSEAAPATGGVAAAKAAMASKGAPLFGAAQQPKAAPTTSSEPMAVALFDYDSTDGGISFKKGDRIVIKQKDDSGWWQGELNGNPGWFPSDFLEMETTTKAATSAATEPAVVKPALKSALKPAGTGNKEAETKSPVSFPKKEVAKPAATFVEPENEPVSMAAKKDLFGGVKAAGVAGGGSSSKSYRVRPVGKLNELPKVPEPEPVKPAFAFKEAAKAPIQEAETTPQIIKEAPKVSKLQFQGVESSATSIKPSASQSVRGKSTAAPIKSSSDPIQQPKSILKTTVQPTVAEPSKLAVSISNNEETPTLPKPLGEYDSFCKKFTTIFESLTKSTSGQVSNAPHLKIADKKEFSISICTVNGVKYSLGNVFASFSLQQSVYPFLYALGSSELKDIDQFVDNQPCSLDNQFVLPKNKVQNGICDAGALLLSSKLFQNFEFAERMDELASKLSNFSSSDLTCQLASYLSLKKTNYTNKALAYWLKENLPLPNDVDETLDLFFSAKSIYANSEQLAVMAATLANNGICPVTKNQAVSAEAAKKSINLMKTCSLGSKSNLLNLTGHGGDSGCLFYVIPNVAGISVYSPLLNDQNISSKAVEVGNKLQQEFNF